MQQQVNEKHANTPLPSLDQISSMQLQDLFKFKNQLACESVAEALPQYLFIEDTGENVEISLTAFNLPPNLEDVNYIGKDGLLTKYLDKKATVSDISKVYSELTARLEEISQVTPEQDDDSR